MSVIKNISLYIPHVFPNFDREYLEKAFNGIGEISHIDFVAKQDRNGNNYNSVYVHFKKWYTNKKAQAFYDSVVDESKDARLYYDNIWYWIVLPNTAKKHIPGDRKPRIDLSELKNSVEKEDTNVSLTEPSENLCSDESLTLKSEKEAEKEKKAAEKFNERKANAAKRKAGFDEWDINQITYYQKKLDERKIKFEKKWGKIEEDEHLPEVLPVDEVEPSDYAQMDEIEEMMAAEDANLVSVDGRYLQAIEAENWAMRQEIVQLRTALINMEMMLQAEVAKVRAFSSSSVDL
jgi:hypothetical protein